MRLIDAEEMVKNGWTAERVVQVDSHTMEWQKKKPTDFPTIDAVPVVRCKDCKHSFMLFGRMHCESFADTDYLMLDEYDFCCRGERKDDG